VGNDPGAGTRRTHSPALPDAHPLWPDPPLTMPQQEALSTANHVGFQRRLPNDVIEDRPLGYWVALRLPM
jgi:hypothetical protein